MVGSAVVSLAAGARRSFGLCLVWVGVTTSLLWRKLRQRSKLGRTSNLMTCLQILYFFQGREEEGRKGQAGRCGHIIVFQSKEGGIVSEPSRASPGSQWAGSTLCNFSKVGRKRRRPWPLPTSLASGAQTPAPA